jgi:hypothetical protein
LVNRTCSCSPSTPRANYSQYLSAHEDISHGSLALTFPLIAYKYGLFNSGAAYFTNTEMTRFRNMFAKKIWKGTSDPYSFYNSVNGTDNGISAGLPTTPNSFDMMALTYMQFYKFDDLDSSPSPIYDVIMNFYKHKVMDGNPASMSQGNYFTGLADLINAQWDKECVNLKLYNRDLVYDQDFNVKNTLIIEPANHSDFNTVSNSASYADPVIRTEEFIIESNVKSTMTAGEEIILKPGFIAKAGCNFKASINEGNCTDGRTMSSVEPVMYTYAMIPDDENINLVSADEEINIVDEERPDLKFGIFPNPGNGIYTVEFENETIINPTGFITVYNFMGELILKQELKNPVEVLNISGNAKGIYYVKIERNGEVKTQKIIYE